MAKTPAPAKCAICGTSLLDKPRINDLCLTCDFEISHKGDLSILTGNEGEEWKKDSDG